MVSNLFWGVSKYFSFFSYLVPSDPEWPTDAPPNTVAPTSQAPTTIAPTTLAQTTLAPTTEAPEEETTKSDSPSGGLLKIFMICPSLDNVLHKIVMIYDKSINCNIFIKDSHVKKIANAKQKQKWGLHGHPSLQIKQTLHA